jgi:SAM-dependent methyltransferase
MSTDTRRRYLTFPPRLPGLPAWRRVLYVGRSLVEFPFYWIAAFALGVPGMAFRWYCFRTGLRLLAVKGSAADAYRCIVAPMDSVRHFEMDFFWTKARAGGYRNVLDISSPRLFTLLLLRAQPRLKADFLNPDAKDLRYTVRLAVALGLSDRCRFESQRLESFHPGAGGYGLVVCMSVLEHIVDDLAALRTMWSLVAPGGRLLLSVPCAATGMEEYTDLDEYELLEKDDRGFVFWQRYYDDDALARLFAITGQPASLEVYGERAPGRYDADVARKRTDPAYPRWREPYTTARTYARQPKLSSLPGMGVVAMEFVKPAPPAPRSPDGLSR